MEPITFVLIMLAVGISVGLLNAALGIGGGVLMVPAFLWVFPEMDINTAKGSSLLAIVFVAGYNSLYMNRGDMKNPWRLVGAMAAGSVVGGFVGGWATSLMPDTAVTIVFVALLALAGFRTFFIQQREVHEEEVRERDAASVGIGVLAGIGSGATGTGAGTVLVPLALFTGVVSNERVVSLSNTVMVATAAAGALAHGLAENTTNMPYTYGMVNISLAPIVFGGAIAGAPFGRWINARLSLPRRRVVMGVLLLFIAARLVWRLLD